MLVVAIIIIVLCLLQGGKSEGASGAITGGGLNVFVKTKERGAEKVVSVLTCSSLSRSLLKLPLKLLNSQT